MSNFKIGDTVVYTPNLPDLLPKIKRIRDHGILLKLKYGTHYTVKFYNTGYISDIHYTALSYLDYPVVSNDIKIIEIPIGTYDPITYYEFRKNDIIVDFLRTDTKYESEFNLYYSEFTFNQLINNPMTLKEINRDMIKKYYVSFF
jgi:hypothetical protein